MKKLRIMILLIIVSFSFFLMLYLKKRNYELSYKIGSYSVNERYIKNDKKYYVTIKYKDNEYFYIIDNKYSRKRKLVSNIKYISDDKYSCLLITFDGKKQKPSCLNKDSYVSYHMIDEDLKKEIDKKLYTKYKSYKKKSYKGIDINNLYGKKILVWNYHGFYYLSKNKLKEIKMFNNDTYNASLIGQLDKYLVLPNYNESYEYKNLKVLNIEDFKIDTLKLSDNMSEDSYVLGTNQDSIFYYDKKYHREFEIVPYKLVYRLVNNYIYEKGNKVDKSEIYLSNNEVKFTYNDTYSYRLIDGSLYRYNQYNNYKEKITDLKVKEIVKEDNKEVYFVSDDKLYVYSDKYGLVNLLEYFELNFNYKNIFYIFD